MGFRGSRIQCLRGWGLGFGVYSMFSVVGSGIGGSHSYLSYLYKETGNPIRLTL